jgi:ammonia channel protein AmtB
MGFHDHAGALLIWALPAALVLGIRLFIPAAVLPAERVHDLKGYKILPGMKYRFFLSRGLGFTMIFLVLNAPTLLDHKWVISKTLTLIPASITMLFCSLLFYGLFGKNPLARLSYAPAIFAVMASLVATQACHHYTSEQAAIASIATTAVTLLYLRHAPLKIRIWDPVCAVPIFMIGGFMGIVMASITGQAKIIPQCLGILTCLVVGMGSGGLLSRMFRS